LYQHAVSQNIYIISLGVDTNFYGKIGNIGLAIYKLRTGGKIYIPRYNKNIILNSFNFDSAADNDTLVFLSNGENRIQHAKLFLNDKTQTLDKYSQLLSSKTISVEVVSSIKN
jgi:hypothetical protein